MGSGRNHVSVFAFIALFFLKSISADENGLKDVLNKEIEFKKEALIWSQAEERIKDCIIDAIKQLPDDITVNELRARCQVDAQQADTVADDFFATNKTSMLDERLFDERVIIDNPFVITAHKPNYVMPITFNSRPNEIPYAGLEGSLQNAEVKFQLSLKFQVAKNILVHRSLLFVAYTNQSYWQAYNRDFSSPFRETNHEPEMFLIIPQNWKILSFKNRIVALGISHQSNGRPGTQSRSWNRIYSNFIFEHRNIVFSLRPWYRIPETRKKSLSDPKGDDNPDILNYMGYGEVRVIYKYHKNTVTLMLRNLINDEYKGAVEMGWSFPLGDKAKGYIQYFNGYGESLIDYNVSINRLSVGVALTDWL